VNGDPAGNRWLLPGIFFLEKKRIGVIEKNGSEVASPKVPKPEGPRAGDWGEVLGEGQQAVV